MTCLNFILLSWHVLGETEEYHYQQMVCSRYFQSHSSFEKLGQIYYTFLKVYTLEFICFQTDVFVDISTLPLYACTGTT